MLKKSIKNVLLVVSVLTAFVLVYQIWFSSYFLPDGYDYLVSGFRTNILNPVLHLFHQENDADFSQNLKKLYKPEKIIMHYSGNRFVFQIGADDFEELHTLSTELFSDVLLGNYKIKSKETVDMDTYLSVLKGKSVYVDYGKDCDFRLFSHGICGRMQNQLTNDLSIVNGYIISFQDSVLNDVSFYIMDKKSGNIYRYLVEIDKNQLENELKTYVKAQPTGVMPSYSFELNFHKEQEQSVSKVLFDPLLLIDLVPLNLPAVQEVTQETFDQEFYNELTDAVLDMFSINKRTMWKYTNLDGARVFVENNGTLTLYPDGVLEYQTVQGNRGLDITNGADKTNYDIYTATANAVDFVTALCSHMTPDFFEHLQIQTSLINDASHQNSYRIAFDYVVDGIPVRHKTSGGYSPSIEMEIDNGYLKSYRQYMKTYERAGEADWEMPPMLTAADILVDSLYNDEQPLRIQKVSICYVADSTGKPVPKWNIVADGAEWVIE